MGATRRGRCHQAGRCWDEPGAWHAWSPWAHVTAPAHGVGPLIVSPLMQRWQRQSRPSSGTILHLWGQSLKQRTPSRLRYSVPHFRAVQRPQGNAGTDGRACSEPKDRPSPVISHCDRAQLSGPPGACGRGLAKAMTSSMRGSPPPPQTCPTVAGTFPGDDAHPCRSPPTPGGTRPPSPPTVGHLPDL